MPRPGGNPDLAKFKFTTERDEPCTAILNLRVPPSLLLELKSREGWQDLTRDAIANALKQVKADTTEREQQQFFEVETSHHHHEATANHQAVQLEAEETLDKKRPDLRQKRGKPKSQSRDLKNTVMQMPKEAAL